MVGTLIVTHGGLAAELLAAGEIITGGLRGFEALSLGWSEGFEEARAKIAASLERLDSGDGVIILTDMYGDTPSRAALSLARPGRIEVVTGVNLPMVVRLGCLSGQAMRLEVLARWLAIKGRRAIARAAAATTPAATGVDPARGGGGA